VIESFVVNPSWEVISQDESYAFKIYIDDLDCVSIDYIDGNQSDYINKLIVSPACAKHIAEAMIKAAQHLENRDKI
jgi:hypothetical protein